MKRRAFDENKIDLLLRVINKIILEDGSFSPEKIGMILEICSFMESNGLDNLKQADSIIKLKTDELNEIKDKIYEFKRNIAKLKQKEAEALTKRRSTRAELRKFSFTRKAFDQAGINFREFQKFSKVISVILKLDSNPKLIMTEMKKTSDLESRKSSLEKDCEGIEKNLEILKKQQQERINYNHSYELSVDLVNKTLVHGVSAELIVSLFNTIINYKLDAMIEDFINDIDTYGGTKSAIFKCKRELENLTREKGDLMIWRNSSDSI